MMQAPETGPLPVDGRLSYAVLDPGSTGDPQVKAQRRQQCALAVMAKAPRPGKVKTRLSPPLTLTQTAALNICFLRDTTRNIADVAAHCGAGGMGGAAGVVGAVGMICYTPVGDEAAFEGILPAGFVLIPQRGQAFGERLLAAAEDILACGFGAVCLIDSDSPTLPATALHQAVAELARPGDRVVLGPSEDGGYYLIGLKQAHAAPFERITWSTSSVYAETVERVREAGIALAELPVWYDVDDAATLAVLEQELLENTRPAFASVVGSVSVHGYDASSTRAYLARMRPSPRPPAGEPGEPVAALSEIQP